MNVGFEIVNSILNGGSIGTLLEGGFNQSWLSGIGTGSEVIFNGEDLQAYQFILKHYRRHHKTPPLEIFREHFPIYPVNDEPISVDELTELAAEKVNSFLVADLIGKTIDYHDRGQIDSAISLIKSEGSRLDTDIRYRKSRADNLSDPSFDVEELLERNLEMGVPFGVYPVDDGFYGFQPGQLITVLGRQKAGKTTFTLNSALSAWKEGYTVLFFSVEMDTDMLRQRLFSIGSHVSPSRMRRGHLTPSEKDKVRDFHHQMVEVDGEDQGRFFISKKKSLITLDDIYAEVAQYNPNVVYIDGFNFMVDRRTNKMTDDWQANENVAAELKTLALEEGIVIIVNTQVQEKQYHAKFGIEASTISSGTGLLKASDLVVGLDKTGLQHTISCVLSRYEYFENTVVEVDWDTMTFIITEKADLEGSGI